MHRRRLYFGFNSTLSQREGKNVPYENFMHKFMHKIMHKIMHKFMHKIMHKIMHNSMHN